MCYRWMGTSFSVTLFYISHNCLLMVSQLVVISLDDFKAIQIAATCSLHADSKISTCGALAQRAGDLTRTDGLMLYTLSVKAHIGYTTPTRLAVSVSLN